MNRFHLVLGQGISRPPTPKVVDTPTFTLQGETKCILRSQNQKVSGMLEVISPEDGFVLEKCVPLSRRSGFERTDAMKEQKNWQNGRLHVFGPKGSIGCRKEPTSRPYTPSKRILLCSAKSLDKHNTLTSNSENQNPKPILRLPKSIQEEAEIHNDPHLKGDLYKLNHETKIIGAKTESKGETGEASKNVEETPNSEVRNETQGSSAEKQNADEKPSDSSGDDERNCEQSHGEAKERTAPLELMGEFLKAIMERDYKLAKKLCQMILIYEPQNPEAKQFLPLIERKLQLESIQEADGERTDEGSTEDSEEDTSDTEDSGTETEASSEDSET